MNQGNSNEDDETENNDKTDRTINLQNDDIITFMVTVEYDGTAFNGFQRTNHIALTYHPSNLSSLHLPFKHRGHFGRGPKLNINVGDRIPYRSL